MQAVRLKIVLNGQANMDVSDIVLFFGKTDESVMVDVSLVKVLGPDEQIYVECNATNPVGLGTLADDANLSDLVDSVLTEIKPSNEWLKAHCCFAQYKGTPQYHMNEHQIEFSGVSVEPQDKLEADDKFKADLKRVIDFYLAMEYRKSSPF